MRKKSQKVVWAFGALLAATVWSAPSRGEGFQLNRYSAPPTGSDGIALQLPDTLAHRQMSAQLIVDMARNPLVLEDRNSGAAQSLVSTATTAHAAFAIGLFDRFEAFAVVPVTLGQSSADMSVSGVSFAGPDSSAFGDARVGGSFQALRSDSLSLGASASMSLPTGKSEAFAGDGGIGMEASVLASLRAGPVTYASSLGMRYRPSNDFEGAAVASELHWRAGAYYPLMRATIMAEFDSATTLSSDIFRGAATPGELLVGARHPIAAGFEGKLGAGVGLGEAIGVPSWRMLASLVWTSSKPKKAAPALVVVEPEPAVVAEAADPDPDGDGILEDEDLCPEDAEDFDNYEDEDGCPEIDNDGDGIVDADDPCPLMAETATDADNYDGCPELERVVKIVDETPDLPEPIQFKFRSAELLPSSYPKLQLIADVLRDNSQLTMIEIQGHTSSEGSESFNQSLSEARAAAVEKALVERGVSPSRLRSRGYGPSRPVAGNETEEGRELNRRVEYVIVEMNGGAAAGGQE